METGEEVGVEVGLEVGEEVGSGVGEDVAVGDGVGDSVGAGVGVDFLTVVFLGAGVGVGDGEEVWVGVGVGVGEGETDSPATSGLPGKTTFFIYIPVDERAKTKITINKTVSLFKFLNLLNILVCYYQFSASAISKSY